MPDMVETGLRERSKARRRCAIIQAAYRLFAERGYAATTVADIAEAAEVAPRTVALYFRSKQDIALSQFTEAADTLTAALRTRCPGETAISVLGEFLRAKHAQPEAAAIRELDHRMFQANPELRALRTARMATVIREGTNAIAQDTGRAPDDIGPRIAAAAAVAVILELGDDLQPADREEATATALDFLEAGIATL